MLRFLKRRWLLLLLTVLLAPVAAVNVWMTLRSRSRLLTVPAGVPVTDVALVLGTGKTINGRINEHFRVRMDAAAALYQAGRVRHFLLSGDNSRTDYNEPNDMRGALKERGVPAAAMTCDFAGFRTLDSVVRAKEVFGVTKCVIVSDDFHVARALWLADCHDIEAVAFYQETVPWSGSWKSRGREWLARVKAVADQVTGKQPHFGGERVPLPVP